jgi:hypothetical protein
MMAEGKRRDEWSRASSLIAMIYNMNRGPGQHFLHPREFDPFATKAEPIQLPFLTMLDALLPLTKKG